MDKRKTTKRKKTSIGRKYKTKSQAGCQSQKDNKLEVHSDNTCPEDENENEVHEIDTNTKYKSSKRKKSSIGRKYKKSSQQSSQIKKVISDSKFPEIDHNYKDDDIHPETKYQRYNKSTKGKARATK